MIVEPRDNPRGSGRSERCTMHLTLSWFRSGVGLVVLFVALAGAVTAVVLVVPSEVGRIVGASFLAVGLVALAWRAIADVRRRGQRG